MLKRLITTLLVAAVSISAGAAGSAAAAPDDLNSATALARTEAHRIIRASIRTMNATPRSPDTRLVHIKPGEEWDRCPYGFTDTIRKQGDTLFCSLLFVQAARQLSDLLGAAGRETDAADWHKEGDRVAASIRKVFWDPPIGLFRAATVCCKEHDIWGSAFAVYLGVADAAQAKAT